MPNWCMNAIHVSGKDVSKFITLIKETERKSKTIGGIFALNEFLAEAGFTTAEIKAMERRNDSTMVNSRGTVISMDEIPNEMIDLYATSAWGSCAAVFVYAAKKLGLDVDIQYEAIEGGNGYYVLSNPDIVNGKVDNYDIECHVDGTVFDGLFEDGEISSYDDIITELMEVYGDDVKNKSLEELGNMIDKTLADDEGTYLYIHQYSQEVIPEPVFPTAEEMMAVKKNDVFIPTTDVKFTEVRE